MISPPRDLRTPVFPRRLRQYLLQCRFIAFNLSEIRNYQVFGCHSETDEVLDAERDRYRW